MEEVEGDVCKAGPWGGGGRANDEVGGRERLREAGRAVRQRTSVTERTDGVEGNGTALRALCHSSAVLSTPTPSAAAFVSLH